MKVSIRPAVEADAEGLAAVHLQGWVEAYSHLLSPEFFSRRDPLVMAERWRATLAAPNPAISNSAISNPAITYPDLAAPNLAISNTAVIYLVAETAGEIIGMASAGPARGDAPPRPDELFMMYVLASHYGAGVGQALLDSAIGTRPASLWVAEDNPRAQAFYRRNGFIFDGARDIVESWENMAEVRMVR